MPEDAPLQPEEQPIAERDIDDLAPDEQDQAVSGGRTGEPEHVEWIDT